jgi:hypothetical protein
VRALLHFVQRRLDGNTALVRTVEASYFVTSTNPETSFCGLSKALEKHIRMIGISEYNYELPGSYDYREYSEKLINTSIKWPAKTMLY